jgi:hypothetical protein
MTKQDFELIENVLHKVKPHSQGVALTQWQHTVDTFKDWLEYDINRFNGHKFKIGCEHGNRQRS